LGGTVFANFSSSEVRVSTATKFLYKVLNQTSVLSCCFFVLDKYDVAPWAIEAVLEYVKQSYGNPPVYILENGLSHSLSLSLSFSLPLSRFSRLNLLLNVN